MWDGPHVQVDRPLQSTPLQGSVGVVPQCTQSLYLQEEALYTLCTLTTGMQGCYIWKQSDQRSQLKTTVLCSSGVVSRSPPSTHKRSCTADLPIVLCVAEAQPSSCVQGIALVFVTRSSKMMAIEPSWRPPLYGRMIVSRGVQTRMFGSGQHAPCLLAVRIVPYFHPDVCS